MNSVASALVREIEGDVERKGGVTSFQSHALKHLELKTVVRLAFNLTQPELRNLFATVGKDQVTVYDDLHMGDYISVVVHFTNVETQHHAGGELTSLTWLGTAGVTAHPYGDACLAVAGPDPVIQIISVAEAKVVAQLKGHTSEVVDLSAPRDLPGLLLSLSKDGNIRLWNTVTTECLASLQTDAFTAEIHPSGTFFMTGHKGGKLSKWPIPLQACKPFDLEMELDAALLDQDLGISGARLAGSSAPGSAAAAASGSAAGVPRAEDLVLASDPEREPLALPGPLSETVDCMRFLPGGRVAAKSCDGRITVWNYEKGLQLTSFRVPDASTLPSHKGRCTFGHTADGTYICAGNNIGEIFVYNSHTAAKAGHVHTIKVNGPVRSCAISHDCRHLLAVVGNGFIFRFEYVTAHERDQANQRPRSLTASNDQGGNAEPGAAGARQATEGGGSEQPEADMAVDQ